MTDEELERERRIIDVQSQVLLALAPLPPLGRRSVLRAILAMHGHSVVTDHELLNREVPEKAEP